MNYLNENNGHYARTLNASEKEKLLKEKVTISEYKINKLEIEAKKNWDLFYKRNKGNFFKDRHWTKREFEELTDNTTKGNRQPILLEVGCGAGNFIFPLISEGTKFYSYVCDFSPRAIELVKSNKLYTTDSCQAFVCDITENELVNNVPIETVDVATLIFVLSAIHPDKMVTVLKNIFQVLQPGGVLLFRDYGLFDQAMLRFKPGHKLSDQFYVRQDNTRAFYFSEEDIENLVTEAGFKIVTNGYISRETINHKESLCVPRVYIQGKFLKPR